MGLLPILFVIDNTITEKAYTLIIFFHGIISPLLFLLVGSMYTIHNTRQLNLIAGSIFVFPVLSFIAVLCFIITLPTPPAPSFLGEAFRFFGVGQN